MYLISRQQRLYKNEVNSQIIIMRLKNNKKLNLYIYIYIYILSMSKIKRSSQACSKVTKLSKVKELSLIG